MSSNSSRTRDLYTNYSGAHDPTAGKALTRIVKEERDAAAWLSIAKAEAAKRSQR